METPEQTDVVTAARQLQAGVFLLDVREPDEIARCALAGATHIPLRELGGAIDSLPKDRDILVLCHHGGRSHMVTRYLRANGFPRASNVAGGIDAWARQVDPTLPRY